MNSSFKTILKDSGMTMYSLAKKTRLPYTTVNNLVNNRLDINKCSADAVSRMSKVLGVTMEQLVDKYDFLTGTEGEYLGVKYKWTKDDEDHQLLVLVDEECEVVAWQTEKLLTNENRRAGYQSVVRLAVRDHLRHKQSKARLMEVRRKYVRQ